MKKTFAIIIANKLLLFAVAIFAASFFGFGAIYYENLKTYDSGFQFLNQWSLWDANSYVQIARDWYHGKYFAYFPLFPIILKIFSCLTFGNYALAGLLLNMAFSFGTGYFLFKICKEEFKNDNSGFWANIFLFFFPAAFFFTAIYTEALFLFLATAMMFFMKKKNWPLVISSGFFAAMTREVGGALILPIAYFALKDFKTQKTEKILAVFSPVLGVCAVLFIYYLSSGDPLIFLEKHGEFGKTLSLPYVPIINETKNLFGSGSAYAGWNLFCFLFTAILTWFVYKKLPKEYFLYCLAILIPPLCSSNLEGYSRYLLAAFPLFMILAVFKNKSAKIAYLLLFVPLLVLFCARYVTGGTWIIPDLP